ncbi:MAG: hypothetical protein A2161_18605 [Candidatus Schekmanbacteria bacterium RBG_13_48_7]|uniref:Response regulatory domain-containing protein n=1 Tax=Candidatus Schekmanbacteria bacterium RBG_13_48_7 TaxID=1817878 RepID=A0A1F7S431_9BACT|nr:MAG: hypothetical protein A2161_18605 [Candidatus Schekmanbacteria bacterium RBG_13_48_7]
MEILIIDDDELIQLMVGELVNHTGNPYRTACDGIAALKKIEEKKPDIIISDIVMPKMDGFELCRRIKQDHNLKDIYFMVLTAKNSRTDKEKGFNIGADDYLVKPIIPWEFNLRLQAGIRIKKLQHEILELRQNKVITEMAGAVAHELNQPLTAVLGLIHFIKEDLKKYDNEEIYRYFLKLENQIQRIVNLIRKIQQIKRYEVKEYTRNTKIVDFEKASGSLSLEVQTNFISVVDDEQIMGEIFAEVLKEKRFIYKYFPNGKDALVEFRKNPPGLVFLDVNMPGMNGLEVLQQLRSFSPDSRVVIMSGFLEENEEKNLSDFGAADFLKKPFSMMTLERMIEDYNITHNQNNNS